MPRRRLRRLTFDPITRVEGVRGIDVSAGPDRKSRAPHLMKRGKSHSVACICDEAKFFVAHIRDETKKSSDFKVLFSGSA